jgi:Na+/H+-translocating membrane pyrophosphatase
MQSNDLILLFMLGLAALAVAYVSFHFVKEELNRILRRGGGLALLPAEEQAFALFIVGFATAFTIFRLRGEFPELTPFKLYLNIVGAMLVGLAAGAGSSAIAELRAYRRDREKQGLHRSGRQRSPMTIFNTVLVSLIMSTLPALFVGMAAFMVFSWLFGLFFSSAVAVTIASIPGCVCFLLTFCQLLLWWLKSAGLSE